MFNLFKFLGSSDNYGGPIVDVDMASKSLLMRTKLIVETLAAAYTVTVNDSGKVFIVNTAITVTLPASSAAMKGVHVTIVVGADVAVTIAATAGELVAFNDVAANSIAFSTSAEKAGNAVHFVNDGTKWYALVHLAAETATPTIAT